MNPLQDSPHAPRGASGKTPRGAWGLLCVLAITGLILSDARAASGDSTAFSVDTRSKANSATTTVGTGVIGILGNSGAGSLRDSIAAATSGDTLTFHPSVDGMIVTLGGTPLTIDKNLTISAASLPGGFTVSGNNASRVFQVAFGNTVAFHSLAITGGNAGGGLGGGILNSGGNLSLTNSTVSGNTAAGGGGIHNNGGTLTLLNATFAGNSATNGGAVRNAAGTLAVFNSTFALNSATGFGGGIDKDGGTLSIQNSIVAANTGPPPGNGRDIAHRNGGSVLPAAANLVGDNDTVAASFPAGPLAGTTASPRNPLLAALGDYGGRTATMALLAGSPAVNTGIVTGSTPATDQRGTGFARVLGGAPDLGAYETGNDAGYATWALERIPTGNDGAFGGDAENDKFANGNEYAYKLNPIASDNLLHPSPTVVKNGGNFEMHVIFPFRPGARDLVYIVERSANLSVFAEIYRLDTSTWIETITSPPVVTADINVGAMTVEVIDRDTAAPRTYWRIRADLIAP